MSSRFGGLGVLGAMVVPQGPDDTAARAHNNYVRAVGFGQPVDGRPASHWHAEAGRLYAERDQAAGEGAGGQP